MKCCVLSCANYGNSAPPSANVFYYKIPKEFDLRQLWTKAIGTPEWDLRPNSAVCSAHFGEFDFVISETGDKKLIYGAVPSLRLTCRVCLAMDRKMFNIREHNLHHFYKMIVGVTVEARDRLPQMMCWECTSKLLSFKKFKEQAQTSQLLLSDKLAVDNVLTVGDVKSIDRIHYNLKSSLTMKRYEPNEFDFNIEVFDLEMKPMEVLLDIKSEHDQGPTLEIDGSSPTCKITKCTKVEPESNNLVKLMMLDLKQNIDVMDTSEPYISDELHSDISQQAEHSDSKVNTKPTRQRVKKVVPAAERKRPKRDLNVQKKGNSAAKVNPFGKMELPCFEIRDLTPEEQQAAMAARALSAAYLTAPYKCDDCYKAFLSETTLARHALRHTETVGPYCCAVCKYRFRQKRQMRLHINMRHASKYTCRDCGMVTQDRSAAIIHQREHNGTNIYQCSHCPVTFRKRTSLLGHLRVKHSSRFACELCGYTFLNQNGVNTHKRKSHILQAQVKLEGPYCEECKLRFASDEAYQRHLTQSSVHSSDSNPNRVRNEIYTYKLHPRKAVKRRAAGKPIPCEECGEQQDNYREYGKHFRAAHPGLVRTKYPLHTGACMCEQCGKRFRCAALLREHMAWHEGVKRHRCDVCDKVLSNKYLLRAHRLKHGSQPPPTYPCPHCERTFSCTSNRARHVKTVHERSTRVECKICGKEFATMWSMRDHMDHVHHKKPWPKRVRAPGSRTRPSTDHE